MIIITFEYLMCDLASLHSSSLISQAHAWQVEEKKEMKVSNARLSSEFGEERAGRFMAGVKTTNPDKPI